MTGVTANAIGHHDVLHAGVHFIPKHFWMNEPAWKEIHMTTEQELRDALKGAFQLRARMYYYIFCELRDALGEKQATDLMKRAIARGGKDASERFKRYAPGNMDGLKEDFLKGMPDKGSLFQPEVCACSSETGLEIQFHACPLKEVYEAMGLSDEEKAKMLAIASAIDHGLFTGAGFEFSAETWQPGRDGCCRLHVKPGKPAAS